MELKETHKLVAVMCLCWSIMSISVVSPLTFSDFKLSNFWNRPEISPEFNMTITELIENRGYPVEVHHVTTSDGYILELHRIPNGRDETVVTVNPKRVVYLQHGLSSNDHVWVISPSDKALAFMLADRGYDVWLPNSRGTDGSRKHASLDPNEAEYWNFSWDEMARDIPACINYMLEQTGQPTLSYIGHSHGCTLFYMAMIQQPELNEKIDIMIALGTATTLLDPKGSIKMVTPFWRLITKFRFLYRKRALLSFPDWLRTILKTKLCGGSIIGNSFCRDQLFSLNGYSDLDHFNASMSTIFAHYPSGASFNSIAHFMQSYFSQEFTRFDYGRKENLKRYGQVKPPIYDLSQVTAPVILYSGEGDFIATPKLIAWTAERLGNLRENIKIDDPKFTHGDFFWSTRVDKLLYNSIFSKLPSPS